MRIMSAHIQAGTSVGLQLTGRVSKLDCMQKTKRVRREDMGCCCSPLARQSQTPLWLCHVCHYKS
jgi:hypothetical protein